MTPPPDETTPNPEPSGKRPTRLAARVTAYFGSLALVLALLSVAIERTNASSAWLILVALCSLSVCVLVIVGPVWVWSRIPWDTREFLIGCAGRLLLLVILLGFGYDYYQRNWFWVGERLIVRDRFLVAVSRPAYEELTKSEAAKDDIGMSLLMERQDAIWLRGGERTLVLSRSGFRGPYELRILDGDLHGRVVWADARGFEREARYNEWLQNMEGEIAGRRKARP